MRKVAIILHGLGANGIDTLYANLSPYWDYSKYEITYLIAVDKDSHQFWEEKVVVQGVRVIHLHDLDKRRLLKWPKTLLKALKDYGPFDVVHSNMDMLNGINVLIAKLAGVSVRISHAHTSSSNNVTIKKKIYISLMRLLMNTFSTNCIACSDVAGQYFFGKDNYETIYNGIELRKYKPTESTIMDRQNNLYFVSVGRFTPPKNPFFLLEVFYEIHKRMPDSKLRWVGDGELKDGVVNKANSLELASCIEFLGIRNNVDQLLQKCNYFLLPSLYEGLSLALAEAQAALLDCFVSDTVSKMSDCGKCVFIPLDESPEFWADEICEFIKNKRVLTLDEEKLKMFDIRTMATRLSNMYSVL